MGEIIQKFGIGGYDSYRYNLDSAKNRAAEIEGRLQGNNPILYNEPTSLTISYDDNYYSSNFPSYYKDGEVQRTEVPFSSAKSNPDAYFKPLDIAKILSQYTNSEGQRTYMVHGCIYLGNSKICQAFVERV
jgi:hypothetical protein